MRRFYGGSRFPQCVFLRLFRIVSSRRDPPRAPVAFKTANAHNPVDETENLPSRMTNSPKWTAALLSALAFFAGAAATGHSQTAPTRGVAHAIGAPTFYRDVLPILQRHCQSCHRTGEIGPMSLVTYQQVRPMAHAVADSV